MSARLHGSLGRHCQGGGEPWSPGLNFTSNHPKKKKKRLQFSTEKFKPFVFNFTGKYRVPPAQQLALYLHEDKGQTPRALLTFQALRLPHADVSAEIYWFCTTTRNGFAPGALSLLQKQSRSPEIPTGFSHPGQ